MKRKVSTVIIVGLVLVFSNFCFSESQPIQPSAEATWLTVGQVYRGEITTENPSPWFRFRVFENRRYYLMVFPDFENGANPHGIGDVKISVTSNPETNTFQLDNNDAPDWTEMGFGSFVMVEVIPHKATCSYEGQRCGLKNQFRISQGEAELYLNVQWGGETYPATGTFTIQILSDDIPTMEVEIEVENPETEETETKTITVYQYGADRATWLVNGKVTKPAQTPILIVTPDAFTITMTVNNEQPEQPVFVETDATQTLIIRVKAKKGSNDLDLEQFLVVCESIDGKCYYLTEDRWKVFKEISEIRPFRLAPLSEEPEVVAVFPALMLLPGEVTFYYGYDPVADEMPDMDIATYTWAQIVKR